MADDKNLTRTGIMLAILPAINKALGEIPGLNLAEDKAHLRRAFRAIITVGVRMLLDAGAPPVFIAEQLGEALSHELAERQAAKDAAGEAAAGEAAEVGGAPIFAQAPAKKGTLLN